MCNVCVKKNFQTRSLNQQSSLKSGVTSCSINTGLAPASHAVAKGVEEFLGH
jgi:hypothetical protein